MKATFQTVSAMYHEMLNIRNLLDETRDRMNLLEGTQKNVEGSEYEQLNAKMRSLHIRLNKLECKEIC